MNELLPKLSDLDQCLLCEIDSRLDVQIKWRNWNVDFRECPKCKLFTASIFYFDLDELKDWGMFAFGKNVQDKGTLIDEYMQKQFYDVWDNAQIDWSTLRIKNEKL